MTVALSCIIFTGVPNFLPPSCTVCKKDDKIFESPFNIVQDIVQSVVFIPLL